MLLAINLTLASCVSQEEPVATVITDTQQAIVDAKVWFGPQEEFVVQDGSTATAKSKARTKKIHWDRAITHDNGSVIEVAVKYSSHGVPMRNDTTAAGLKEKQSRSFYRLLIRRDSVGNYSKSLLKFYPEKHVDGQNRLEVNNYMTLSNRFSGDIQLTDWEENLLTGWRITDGAITQTYFPKVDLGGKSRNLAGAALNCVSVTEEVCETTTYPSPPGYLDTVEVNCYFVTYPVGPGCGNVAPGGPGWSGGGGSGGSGPSGPGGGGSGGGSGNVTVDDPIGYELPFENFVLDQNPSTMNWRLSSPSQRFMHLVSHIKRAKDQGLNSLNIKTIFTAWPANIEANGHIKSFYANLNYLGKQIRVYYEMPVAEPWTSINPFGSRVSNDRDECVIQYTRDIGNLRTAYFLFNDNDLCSYFENYLL